MVYVYGFIRKILEKPTYGLRFTEPLKETVEELDAEFDNAQYAYFFAL